jgi:oxygen-independent coproporphyrinogen-3 oxidase
LSIEQLTRVLDGLHALTGFRDSAVEVTAECNPESLDEDKARALLDLGVRRLSIGFQSLHDEVLQLFGRVHSVADSFAAWEAARRAGCESLNLDLIYAVPAQTESQWTSDLVQILGLEPDHVAAYNLTFEEETRFKRWLDRGQLQKAPEEVELRLFEVTRATLGSAGLEAYEVSNYSLDGQQCQHNINYWLNGEYVGLGPGAVSHVGGTRFGNPRALAGYLRGIAAGDATQWTETLAPLERLAETWWLGLRLRAGVDPAAARATAGFAGPGDPALEVALRLAELGHLVEAGGRWRLTERGLPVADAVASEFLSGLRSG